MHRVPASAGMTRTDQSRRVTGWHPVCSRRMRDAPSDALSRSASTGVLDTWRNHASRSDHAPRMRRCVRESRSSKYVPTGASLTARDLWHRRCATSPRPAHSVTPFVYVCTSAPPRATDRNRYQRPGKNTRATKKPAIARWPLRCSGAPGRIRTSDPQVRSLVLYPTELRAQIRSGIMRCCMIPRQRKNQLGDVCLAVSPNWRRVRDSNPRSGF